MKYRHGDVVLRKARNAKGDEVKHSGEFVLARGEKTGHTHKLAVKDPQDMTVRKTKDGGMILTLESEGQLTHQEHGTLTVEPGTYSVGHEQEKDYFSDSVRRVID